MTKLPTSDAAGAVLPEGRRLAIARDEFFASLSGVTLEGAPSGRYLRNRLELAFVEGWHAKARDATPQPPPEAGSVDTDRLRVAAFAFVASRSKRRGGTDTFDDLFGQEAHGLLCDLEAALATIGAAPAPKESP